MTVRADEVRTGLPQEEWGAWTQGGSCVSGFPGEEHPAEPPFFFHCVSQMARIREKFPAPSAHHERDHGLCAHCKGPAELDRKVVRNASVTCAEAERIGITPARLSTRKFCAACDPWANPFCTWKRCREAGRKVRALPRGCCWKTKVRQPHCQDCHDHHLEVRRQQAAKRAGRANPAPSEQAAPTRRQASGEPQSNARSSVGVFCQARKCAPCNAADAQGRLRALAVVCKHHGHHCQAEHDRQNALKNAGDRARRQRLAANVHRP